MTPIRDISNLPPEIKKLEQKQSSKIVRKGSVRTAKTGSSPSSAPIQDKVSISAAGKSLFIQQSSLDTYIRELENIKTLSDEKRAVIKERIRKGDYDRTDVLTLVSNALVRRTDLSTLKRRDSTEKNLDQVAAKSHSGFYNSSDVIDKLTDRLLDSGDL
ncbi:MAG: hypothetical protein ACE5D1_06255 [Fidelibacterota bacterium]